MIDISSEAAGCANAIVLLAGYVDGHAHELKRYRA